MVPKGVETTPTIGLMWALLSQEERGWYLALYIDVCLLRLLLFSFVMVHLGGALALWATF